MTENKLVSIQFWIDFGPSVVFSDVRSKVEYKVSKSNFSKCVLNLSYLVI